MSIFYFTKSLEADFTSIEGDELIMWRACAGCVIILTFYQLYNEVLQFLFYKTRWLKSLGNYNDLFMYLATLWIVFTNLLDYP